MKTAKLKRIVVALIVIATTNLVSVVHADEVRIPVISKPAILQEGTQSVLTEEQVAELLPWAKDSKVFLNDLLNSLQGLSSQDKIDQLVQGITSVVGESAPKNSELLMRYVLNRGLILNEMLNREMDADATGTVDAKIRVLTSSVNMAITNYDNDLALISKKTSTPLAQFGNDYFNFLTELNKSIFDASAQYSIYRTALEWFQWDLYRDLNNKSFASQIIKINNSLKLYTNKKLTDAQALAFIRQMKAVATQVDVQAVITKMKNDEKAAIQKKMDEQNAIARQKAYEQDAITRKIIADQTAIEQKRKAEQDEIEQKRKAEQDEVNRKAREEGLLKKFGPVIETTQVFESPRINSILFSDQASDDGICVVLGYQRALIKKVTNIRIKETLVIVDADGNFTGAKRSSGSTYDNTKYVSSITCANKLVSKKNVQVDKISSFTFVDRIYVSYKSNVNGVCKLLGYEKGLDGSAVKGTEMREVMAIVEEAGNVQSIDSASKPTNLTEVICVNKKSASRTLSLVKLDYPKVEESFISKNSNAQGICKKLGYPKGLEGVQFEVIPTASTVTVIDVTGEIVNTEYASANTLYVKSVVCVK